MTSHIRDIGQGFFGSINRGMGVQLDEGQESSNYQTVRGLTALELAAILELNWMNIPTANFFTYDHLPNLINVYHT